MVSPTQVLAADCIGAISWGETFAYEDNYDKTTNESANGSNLTVVGVVDCFSGPFFDVDPAADEYTVKISGAVSQGTTVQSMQLGPDLFEIKSTVYLGGSFEVWKGGAAANFADNPPNAAVPSTFMDGTLFLVGNIELIQVDVTFVNGAYAGGSINTFSDPAEVFTGGSAFERVNVGGEGCPLLITGGWNVTPSALRPGYCAEVEAKTDVDCPTQTETTTWGLVKSLYH